MMPGPSATAVLLVVRQGTGGLSGALKAPAWMWAGGLMGLLVVFSIGIAAKLERIAKPGVQGSVIGKIGTKRDS